MTKSDDYAFPVSGIVPDHAEGLTKREYFAAIALQGLLCGGAHKLRNHRDFGLEADKFSKYAVKLADELIRELDRTN